MQNLRAFYLFLCLCTNAFALLTSYVNTFLLIINMISSLFTILFYGAKLISLYLFLSILCGKLTFKLVFYAMNEQKSRGVMGYSGIICALFIAYQQGYAHSYPHFFLLLLFYLFTFCYLCSQDEKD